jgi:dipeptidyl aminopeptidase/acylaminoacyl peptidase
MLVLAALKIATGLVAAASMVTLVGPIIGETIATRPPAFSTKAADPLVEEGLVYEEVAFPTTDGLTLRGWFIPAEKPGSAAILYAPATGHDQRSGLSLVPAFHAAGYHVLLFSYRGHAQSDGQRGRFTYGDAESRDVDAAVRFLAESRGINRIATIGHSVGGVSAILSGARNPQVGAVIAVAPFNCVAEVWHTSRPSWVPAPILEWTLWVTEKLRGFKREQICPLDVVDQISPRPLLLIHGTNDRRIPEDQIRQLYAAADAPKTLWLVEGATHSGIRNPVLDQMAPDIISFLRVALRDKPRSSALRPWQPAGYNVSIQ